ncbi:MAG: hypothetical protein D6743_01425 [Calditrichaeota bacterium]|nr:MAG: hypothetical protein D6743_01425 [Calditrichota bacterium]
MERRKVHVYVFGAGASVHLGAPLTKDFLVEGFNLLSFSLSNNLNPELSTDSFRHVAEFLDALYHTNLSQKVKDGMNNNLIFLDSWFPKVTIEEILTFVDLGIDNGQRWKPSFEMLRDSIHDVIFETLDYSTGRPRSFHRNEDGTWSRQRDTCYDVLVDDIVDLNQENCFITFNYDLFLDESAFINHQDIFGDYVLSFDFVENFPSYKTNTENSVNKNTMVNILKLHGSLNWATCDECKKRYLAFFRKYKSHKRNKCNKCNSRLRPILIPPTYKKRIDEVGLSYVWEKAYEILTKADFITIIGYSFPDADIEAKWLFKRAIVEGGRRPIITMVEPLQEVRDRIREFFGKTAKYNRNFETFEQYCEIRRPENKRISK